jgi:HAD superfamily hydrolase (TIGR01509 family)
VVHRFDLVIFDCDGVLVDTERLAVRTEREILERLGWSLSESDIVDLFVGRTDVYMQQVIEAQLGRSVDWESEFEAKYREVFERELVAVKGIEDVLDALRPASCVASNGSREIMRLTLGLTNLWHRFPGRVFSAEDVEHAKPAPDVYLHAAKTLGVATARCAVVEDSVSGVTAGLAAGMTVFGFSGSVTRAERLAEAGAIVFDSMTDLPALVHASSPTPHPKVP